MSILLSVDQMYQIYGLSPEGWVFLGYTQNRESADGILRQIDANYIKVLAPGAVFQGGVQ